MAAFADYQPSAGASSSSSDKPTGKPLQQAASSAGTLLPGSAVKGGQGSRRLLTPGLVRLSTARQLAWSASLPEVWAKTIVGAHTLQECWPALVPCCAEGAPEPSDQQQEQGQGQSKPGGDQRWHDRVGPAVHKLLRESGLSLDQVTPSGPRGIVTKGDVLAAMSGGAAPQPSKVPSLVRRAALDHA